MISSNFKTNPNLLATIGLCHIGYYSTLTLILGY